VDADAEAGLGIAFGRGCFVEPACAETGFEIVLPNGRGDRTGIQSENTSGDGVAFGQSEDQLMVEVLKGWIGGVMKEGAESFYRGGRGE
jgi:hypothetical protein